MENMLLFVVEEKYGMNKINYVWQKKISYHQMAMKARRQMLHGICFDGLKGRLFNLQIFVHLMRAMAVRHGEF